MAQMTKLALAQSLRQLMQERTLDKITVKEVVERCGVNRQTFYYHFRDMYDLLDWMFAYDGEEFEKKYPGIHIDDDGQNTMRALCESLQETAKITLNIYHSLGYERLGRYLHKRYFKLLSENLMMKGQKYGTSHEDCILLANFYTHAFVGITMDWVQEGLSGDVEGIVAKFHPILCGTLDLALMKMAKEC
ncbi:TetR/AcrR family transcriptional regulator C-terminal domain-containing protein [uncultured Sphaerochaeta sp.]|uniref:TetR/AcrR family transcriptional regulator C-terminal domain-containing protein n=1 Tax=uncultured Sphaerochaeta sp. TaxID=886478 RepID=UPI002A0A8ABD|nr:TetR/AcrR family transcriptional regulator C-terminal domain-containing protein [uncultured Sphaerochaeta sp.]